MCSSLCARTASLSYCSSTSGACHLRSHLGCAPEELRCLQHALARCPQWAVLQPHVSPVRPAAQLVHQKRVIDLPVPRITSTWHARDVDMADQIPISLQPRAQVAFMDLRVVDV